MVIGLAVLRVQLQGPGVIRDGLVKITLAGPGQTTTVIGPSVPGVYLQGLGVIGNRLVKITLAGPGQATVQVGPSVPWFLLYGCREGPYGFIILP